MSLDEILGRREDQRLEFKSAEVLTRDLESVAREVVGMLNAEGGEIWIGVEDENDIAVAIRPVVDPARERRRLIDYLLETVDPAPLTDEVKIDARPAEANPAVLVVRVQPSNLAGRRPFAYRKKGGWHFLRRVDARNHPMTREEIFGREIPRDQGDVNAAIQRVLAARRQFHESGRSGLWLALEPAENLDLDTQDPTFEQLPSDPLLSGNRRMGAHFAMANRRPRLGRERIEWEWWSEHSHSPILRGEIWERGSLRFWAALALLEAPGESFGETSTGQGRELDPIALLELPISALRLAAAAYRGRVKLDLPVALDLALLEIDGWRLRRGTPGTAYFRGAAGRSMEKQEESELVWDPLVLPIREITEQPDRCGFRLARRIYQAFGIGESDMPRFYDHTSERLVLPE